MIRNMLQSSRYPLGIDIGARSIKLAQRDGQSDGLPHFRVALVPIPAELREEAGRKPARLSGLLTRALKTAGFRGNSAVLSLPSPAVNCRNIRNVIMPEAELAGAVHWAVARELNLKAGAFTSDYLPAEQVAVEEKKQLELLAVSANTQTLEAYVDLMDSCGLDTTAIDLGPAALVRMTAGPGGGSSEREGYLLVELGYQQTSIILATEDRPFLIRTAAMGTQRMMERIARMINVSADKAEAMLDQAIAGSNEKSAPSAENASQADSACIDAVRLAGRELAAEIGRCIQYFSATFRSTVNREGWIIGAGALQQTLVDTIQQEIGLALRRPAAAAWAPHTGEPVLSLNCEPTDVWTGAAGLSMYPVEQ